MMKRVMLVCVFLAAVCLPLVSHGQISLVTAASNLRTSTANVTTADEIGTTFSVTQDVKAILYYADVVTSSATNIQVRPCGAIDGNAAATGYYGCGKSDYAMTFTGAGRYVWRVPREEFGAYKYMSAFTRGVGTLGGATCTIKYKKEY